MKRHLMFGLAAAVALCGCGRANEKPGATANTASDAGGTPVTLIGCLVPGGGGAQAGAVGTSGNTAANGFTLIDVTTTSTPASDTGSASGVSATPNAAGTSGTHAASPTVDTGTPRSYTLLADRKQDDLQKYSNSQVEVTGVLIASTDTGAGVPDVGAASAPAGTPATDVQRVRVKGVRQLQGTCNAKTR
jgi:hypothetical protein